MKIEIDFLLVIQMNKKLKEITNNYNSKIDTYNYITEFIRIITLIYCILIKIIEHPFM